MPLVVIATLVLIAFSIRWLIRKPRPSGAALMDVSRAANKVQLSDPITRDDFDILERWGSMLLGDAIALWRARFREETTWSREAEGFFVYLRSEWFQTSLDMLCRFTSLASCLFSYRSWASPQVLLPRHLRLAWALSWDPLLAWPQVSRALPSPFSLDCWQAGRGPLAHCTEGLWHFENSKKEWEQVSHNNDPSVYIRKFDTPSESWVALPTPTATATQIPSPTNFPLPTVAPPVQDYVAWCAATEAVAKTYPAFAGQAIWGERERVLEDILVAYGETAPPEGLQEFPKFKEEVYPGMVVFLTFA